MQQKEEFLFFPHNFATAKAYIATIRIRYINNGKLPWGHSAQSTVTLHHITSSLFGVAKRAFLKLWRMTDFKITSERR